MCKTISDRIIIECIYDLFFRKLFKDGYVNIEQELDLSKKSFMNDEDEKTSTSVFIPSMILNVDNSNKPFFGEKFYLEVLATLKNIISDKEIFSKKYFDIDKVLDDLEEIDLHDYLKNSRNKEKELKVYLIMNKIGWVTVNRATEIKTIIEEHDESLTSLFIDEIRSFYSVNSIPSEKFISRHKHEMKLNTQDGYLYDENEIELHIISTVDSFLGTTDYFSQEMGNKIFFRGQTNVNYSLEPSIFRDKKTFQSENDFINFATKQNPEEFDLYTKVHVDILKKMQHYGYPTRLLDITDNLLMSLFFALDGNEAGQDAELIVFKINEEKVKYTRSDNVALVCSLPFLKKQKSDEVIREANRMLIRGNVKCVIDFFNSRKVIRDLRYEVAYERPAFEPRILPSSLKKDYFVQATYDNRRIYNQSGGFIACSLNPENTENLNSYRLKNEKGKKMIFIIREKEVKDEFLKFLEISGINSSTVYPEIDKSAEYFKNNLSK